MKDFNMKIKGVNLGNWLVLEKWMSPELFAGTEAEDEYYLPYHLSKEAYEARIRTHRSEYITERDFMTIKSWGLEAVRIPVPYFIFGDRPPYIGCTEELDRAFDWAERYGLKVLIDLHTAPLSQNGFDNSGLTGVCKWAQTPEEVAFELTVLERLAKRYGQREGLWGIQILNEPMLEKSWEMMGLQNRYHPVDPELAAGSAGIPLDFLKQFYLDAYEIINPYLAPGKYIVMHDGFDFTVWKGFMEEERYDRAILDTHMYLSIVEMITGESSLEGLKGAIRNQFQKEIIEMQQHFPVIVGEWCLANAFVNQGDFTDEEKYQIYQELNEAQLQAWESGCGYFYWSYKLLIDSVHAPAEGLNAWDLGRCKAMGWFHRN